jgi:hypothetical protein
MNHHWLDSSVWALAFFKSFLHSSPFTPTVAFSDIVTICFYGVRLLAPSPTPNLEDQASEFLSPRDRVAQLYPQALDFPFSRLLRHAGVR